MVPLSQVIEALRRRNAVVEQRENQKLQKLELKGSDKQLKEETVMKGERQLCWLIFVSLSARLRLLKHNLVNIFDTKQL